MPVSSSSAKRLALLAGYRSGKPIHVVEGCQSTLTGKRLGALVGYKNGKPVFAVGRCVRGDDGSITTGKKYFSLLVGARDGKPIFAVSCCVPVSSLSRSSASSFFSQTSTPSLISLVSSVSGLSGQSSVGSSQSSRVSSQSSIGSSQSSRSFSLLPCEAIECPVCDECIGVSQETWNLCINGASRFTPDAIICKVTTLSGNCYWNGTTTSAGHFTIGDTAFEMYYDATVTPKRWVIRDLLSDRTWIRFNLDCAPQDLSLGQTFVAQGDYPDFVIYATQLCTINLPSLSSSSSSSGSPSSSPSSSPSLSPSPSPSGKSQSGGSGATVNCCPNALPTVLYITFGGSLAALGAVTVTWDAVHSVWNGSTTACGGGVVTLTCVADNTFTVSALTSYTGNAAPTSCSPLLVSTSGTSILAPCAGAATANVTQ